jgi:hypothetical protein
VSTSRLLGLVSAALVLAPGVVLGLSCTGGSLDVWPDSGSIPQNVQFLLQGTVKWRSFVRDLQPGEVFLESHSDRVEVVLKQRFDGEISQVFFAPARPLKAGFTYWLVVVGDDSDREIPHFRLPNQWRVERHADSERPRFTDRPVLEHQEPLNFSSGGPHRSLYIQTKTNEVALLKVSLGPPGDIPEGRFEFLLRSIKGRPYQIYDGPCGRNYSLRDPRRVLALLSLVDAAGNSSPGLPLRLEFVTAPPELVARPALAGSPTNRLWTPLSSRR